MPIVINGKTVQPDDLERIKIAKSERTIELFIPQIRTEDQRIARRLVNHAQKY
jgi:hypothetical protein